MVEISILMYLKGLLIVLVIGIHVSSNLLEKRHLKPFSLPEAELFSDYFLILIRNMIGFAVPGFLFISGYLLSQVYNRKDAFGIWSFYKKRIRRLYAPFVVWLIIYTLFWGEWNTDLIFSLVFLDGWFHFWFLWLIFISYLLFPFLFRVTKFNSAIVISFLCFIFIFLPQLSWVTISDHSFFKTIYHEKVFIVAEYLFYFAFAIVAALKMEKSLFFIRIPPILFLIIVVSYLICLYVKINNVSIVSHYYIKVLFKQFAEMSFNFISIFGLFKLSHFIVSKNRKLVRFLCVLGISSYGIYLSHMAILYVYRDLIRILVDPRTLLFGLLTFICCVASSYLLAFFMKKNKFGSYTGF